MFSLADITYNIRSIAKYAGIAGAVLLLLFLGFKGIQFIITLVRPPINVPEMAFGKLTPVVFPAHNHTSLQYKINTLSGDLPSLGDRVKIFKIITPEAELGALQLARNRATGLGFTFNETQNSADEFEYSWQDNKGNTLRYNIVTRDFKVLPNPGAQISVSASEQVRDTKLLKESALRTLRDLGINSETITAADANIIFMEKANTALLPASNPLSATAARVYLTQQPVQISEIENTDGTFPSLPVFHPVTDPATPSTNQVSFIASGFDISLFEADISIQNIDRSVSSTYPIISSEIAFKHLEAGNAYIANTNDSTQIEITQVYLAYYIGTTPQEYLLPIIVFQGKNFLAYVNALSPESITN